VKLLVTTGIYPPAIGGPATHIAQVSRALRQRGHEVTVVTLDHGRSREAGVIRIPRGRLMPWRLARTIMTIIRVGWGFDVIYVQGLWIEAGIASVVLRKPIVRKIVGDWAWERAFGRGWTHHRFDEFQRHSYGGRIRMLKLLRTFLTRCADHVIVPSQYLKQCVQAWGVDELRIEVIHNALENPLAILPSGVRRPNRIVAVGRLTRWKGFEEIIRSISRLPGADLVIVGDGPEREHLEHLARHAGVDRRVTFMGQLPHADVLAEVSSASVFVLNSAYEGFPHVLLEALLVGTPVVAAAAGGVTEIIRDGENGLVVQQDDAASITRAISRILRDPSLADRLRAEGRRTLEHFSQKRMLDQLERSMSVLCGA